MKTTTFIAIIIAFVGSASGETNAPENNPQFAVQNLGIYTNIGRIIDFKLLPNRAPTWTVTFRTVNSNTVWCTIHNSHPLIQSNHLATGKMMDLDRRTDFSELPWFWIITETTNTWRGRVTLLKTCDPIDNNAEPSSGGDVLKAAPQK